MPQMQRNVCKISIEKQVFGQGVASLLDKIAITIAKLYSKHKLFNTPNLLDLGSGLWT